MIEFGHGTHPGLRRAINEDTYCADSGLGLFLVADGMGGHLHGMRAAALARDHVCAALRAGESLEDAMRGADRAIIAQQDHVGGTLPMGTTLVALHVRESTFEAAWVGDSRLYLYHDGLRQLSHDQSLVQDLVDHGILDAHEARGNPHRNVLTQALGVTSPNELRIDHLSGTLVPGMRFLLCSDGLSEHVGEPVLERHLGRDDLAAQELADVLLLEALDAGGHDNVTALVLRCHTDRAG